MKKFLVTLLVCMTALTSFAQLNVQTKEQANKYKIVYECRMQIGDIRFSYIKHVYYFCGSTDNQFEKKGATILLGTDKESAIASLNDLENIRKTITNNDKFVVKNADGELNTTLFKVVSLAFREEGVAGTSYALGTGYINFNKARKAITDFNEEAEP